MVLFEREFTNNENQKIRLSIISRDSRRPDIIASDPENPIYEHIERFEVFADDAWNTFYERIIEYILIDRME